MYLVFPVYCAKPKTLQEFNDTYGFSQMVAYLGLLNLRHMHKPVPFG